MQAQRIPNQTDDKTIGGLLEIALQNCKSTNIPKIYQSSRTDLGVHALRTSAHVDLKCAYGELQPRYIQTTINKYFSRNGHSIRVQEVLRVPDTFHARYSAKARHYMYRFAVKKPNATVQDEYNMTASIPIPVVEVDRCYFIGKSKFNVEAAYNACELFVGTKDLIALIGKPNQNLRKNRFGTERIVDRVELKPGRPLLEGPYTDFYNYWEVHCVGRSFFYHQVRRTVAVLIAVAQGILTLDDVQKLFDKPTIHSWNDKATLAPAYGLYLNDVKYDEEDLVIKDEDEKVETNIAACKPDDLQNFTGSIHEKINRRKSALKLQR